MIQQIFNFSAGPAALPLTVKQTMQEEMLDWQSLGVSVAEVSHRSAEFQVLAQKSEQDLRELLTIPDNYHVLFLHGGATHQFAQIPMNLLALKPNKKAVYINTGHWSAKALSEAKLFGEVQELNGLRLIDDKIALVDSSEWQLDEASSYVHLCLNETIQGIQYHQIPETGEIPLVADVSSCLLSEPLDVSKFGMIYACAQKNIGLAGLTIVIIRDDLLGHATQPIASLFDYQQQAEGKSMVNTPPTYSWYVASLVFEWLREQGGLQAMQKSNQQKAQKLYDFIDESKFYNNPNHVTSRSVMNIPFTLAKPAMDLEFLQQAKQHGLLALKGHRSVGGMRASLYNAMPEEGVDALIDFMQSFAME